jgi:hypothetical protein
MSMFLEVLVDFRNQWLESQWLRYFRTVDNRKKYNHCTRLDSVQETRQKGQYTGWEKSAIRLRPFKPKVLIGQPRSQSRLALQQVFFFTQDQWPLLVAGALSSQASPASFTRSKLAFI